MLRPGRRAICGGWPGGAAARHGVRKLLRKSPSASGVGKAGLVLGVGGVDGCACRVAPCGVAASDHRAWRMEQVGLGG